MVYGELLELKIGVGHLIGVVLSYYSDWKRVPECVPVPVALDVKLVCFAQRSCLVGLQEYFFQRFCWCLVGSLVCFAQRFDQAEFVSSLMSCGVLSPAQFLLDFECRWAQSDGLKELFVDSGE